MKTHSVSAVKTSHCQITVATAVLITMLIALSPVNAQTRRASSGVIRKPVNAERLQGQKAAKPSVTQHKGPRSDHRPPITFDEGSLSIGALRIGMADHEMSCVANADTNHPRRYTCTRNTSPARPPKWLAVSITKDDGDIKEHKKRIQNDRWQIRIWLEVEVSDGVFEPVRPTMPDEPQIIFKSPYTIEIDGLIFAPEKCIPTGVSERPCKYEHPGYPDPINGAARHFRVAWIDFKKGTDSPAPLDLPGNRLRVSGSLIPEPH